MSDFKKTTNQIRYEVGTNPEYGNIKWLRADFVKKEIEKHITERNYGTAWANTWRKELLESLGLLDDAQSGEGQPSEELLEVNSLGSLASGVPSKTDVSRLPTNKPIKPCPKCGGKRGIDEMEGIVCLNCKLVWRPKNFEDS